VSNFKTELEKLGPIKPGEYQKPYISGHKEEKKKATLNEL